MEPNYQTRIFSPSPGSLNTHEVPAWFEDAKFGIFMHWSLSSVPAFAPRGKDIHQLLREDYWNMQPQSPYSEWYQNSLKFPWSPAAKHHREVWNDCPYSDFQPLWEAALEDWDPDAWAATFAAAGAKYFVLVTKHHDGYCLWPSEVTNPHRADWFSKRDVVGELATAMRKHGLRFGLYYSGGIDWTFHPAPLRTVAEFLGAIPAGDYPEYAEAQARELIERYQPDVLWNDIAWPTKPERLWQLFADYYAAVPEGVVNDRWATPNLATRLLQWKPVRWVFDWLIERAMRTRKDTLHPPPTPHSDFRTPEYATFDSIKKKKWESVRGIDQSFGYNRMSLPEDHMTAEELLWGIVDIASKNGNLLLNVGPRGEDATIPPLQMERLQWLTAFFAQNGEAIYGTRPWSRAAGKTTAGTELRFTARDDRVFAFLKQPAAGAHTLAGLGADAGANARLVSGGEISLTVTDAGITIEIPAARAGEEAVAVEFRGLRDNATEEEKGEST